jgi:peptidoglycan/xylan/chitin deacetylase (PgdA/CDA1 family)
VIALTHSINAMKSEIIEQQNKLPFFKRVGSYLYVLIILGVALPALVYLAIMQSLGWRVPVMGANAAISDVAPLGNTVILYAPSSTKTYLNTIGGNYDVLVTPWRNYFTTRKLDFQEVQDASQLRKKKTGVLILPSAVSLNEEERNEIAAFRARGGAVLATWATGTRNGKGDWEGWQFLDTLGVKYLGEISADKEINNLILTGESAVSHTHPSGQRIFMSKTSERLLRVKGEVTAGRFMNWARMTDDELRGEGALVFSELSASSGRTAYYAFAESAWESHPLATYNLIDDTLQWLRREPAIVRAAWPNGKLAAQVVEMDTEQEFSNALPFASMMQSMGYPATFYVLTSVGKLFPDVLTKLARDFEIGFHGDVHIGFKGQPANQQEKRMQTMRSEMASVIPDLKGMTGFRAPTEGYDGTTEQLLHKFGIRHHTADPNRTEGRLPLLAKLDGLDSKDSLVILPRTQRDDINLYWEKLTVEQTTKALIDDTDVAIDTGALGLLSIHSQNFNSDGILIKAMPGFLAHLKQRHEPLWIASAGQVADWWRERERLKLSSNFTGKRLEFNITVTGEKPLSGAGLIVMLPQKGILPTVQTLKIGISKPSVSKIDDYRAFVTLGELNPGNYAYQVTFAQ